MMATYKGYKFLLVVRNSGARLRSELYPSRHECAIALMDTLQYCEVEIHRLLCVDAYGHETVVTYPMLSNM
jgi:hypothetical protein